VTRRSSSPAKPHARTKAARERSVVREMTVDEQWAEGIRKSLLEPCHPFQYDAVVDPAKRYSFLVGRGGTKTTCFRVRGVLKCTNTQRAKVLYFASTRARAKDLMWFPLKALLHKLGVEATFNETELRCTITRTGSMYMLSGLQDVADADKWRGDTFDEVQFDECGAIKPELLEYTVYQVIGPRVHCLGVGGTPGLNRRKLFYEVTRPGSELHRPYKDRNKPQYKTYKGYSSHHWTLQDIVDLPGAKKKYPALVTLYDEQLEECDRNKWSADNPIRRRELDAVWAADGTLRVFGDFNPHKDGQPWNEWDPFDGAGLIEGVAGLRIALKKLREMFPDFRDWRFVVPKDQGHKDPFACNPLAFSPHDPLRRIWQVMSFERTGMGYGKPIAELLIGAEEVDTFVKTGVFPTKYGGVFGALGGWPDGLVIDTDNALLEDLKNVYGIKTEKADKKPEYKKGAIELVNGDLVDGRIKVLKGSPLATQLEQLQWKEQDNGVLIEDPAQANHSTDTLVYGRRLIAAMFESGQVAQDAKPQDTQTYVDPMGLDAGIGTEQDAEEEEGSLLPMDWHDDDDWG
jgi:hypothetical protein